MSGRIGVCSWSLRPASARELAERVRACGLAAVQLALDPIRRGEWKEQETAATLQGAGIAIVSGMMAMKGEDYSTLGSIQRTGGVRLDENWNENLAAAVASAAIAQRLGITLVTFHAGFLPHDRNDPVRRTMIDRLRSIEDAFTDRGVGVALETGQETADTLIGVLEDLARPSVGVNFDPANMILYGMGDPVASLRRLASRVVQMHIKDAKPSPTPGQWGTEMPIGQGAVDWKGFFAAIKRARLACDFVIEREGAGAGRIEDIKAARSMVEQMAGSAADAPGAPERSS